MDLVTTSDKQIKSNNDNKRPVTAGIVCYSVNPKTEMIYLLLGKEARNGKIVGRWCDFGGSLTDDETAEDGAAREFCEETMCTIDLGRLSKDTIPVHHSVFSRFPSFSHYMQYVQHMLKNEQYTAKVKVVCERAGERVYRDYFLKRVAWQPRAIEYFNATRSSLLRAHHLYCQERPNKHVISHYLAMHPALVHHADVCAVNCDFLEKQQIMYWSLDRLEEVLQDNGQWRHQVFRQSFLPALRIIVDQLRDIYYT